MEDENKIDNMEMFNIAVGDIFSHCYSNFPIRIDINIMDLGNSIIFDNTGKSSEFNMQKLEFKIAFAALTWLRDAEYIWVKLVSSDSFLGVTLTPKGLDILNKIPDKLKEKDKKSFGEHLRSGVKKLGGETTKGLVKEALSLSFKSFF